MQTVIGAFDTQAHAQAALERLTSNGFDRDDLHIEQQQGTAQPSAMQATDSGGRQGGVGGFFARLFGDNDEDLRHAHSYDEAVRRGSCVLVVDARDEQQADRAATLLQEAGAYDVDERVQQWKSEGWDDQPAHPLVGLQQPAQGTLDPQPPAQGVLAPQPATAGTMDLASDAQSSRDDLQVGKEGVIDVVEEQLQVGKRSVERGGVRVIQRISERPVREVVRLREEEAVVERRPVNREVEAGALDTFREGTLEVRETAEEPVVAKTARVVEEVRVGKQVHEREETIEDTVRRKDVDVERVGGARERERAVASDRTDAPLTERDPDAGSTPAGTRKPRKNL
ncbi:MAG TPA: YsnF/AvaK domain-containing protein [Ramlibacter sp.]|jgi:uncharacterized protein (TIGR02271 family)|uniref:YsnF/AvaK domain-containing protein n=1 Tax=Ramlibacter sp. TaxID=1917967 RepID=UPI002D5B2566|nr:YsnF/AvaK domain-containing protein [Ramlibacter sp.]HZY18116.1 YsnF/AvaK domain-containing protein [Ramlibacter sp.]